MSQTPTTSKPRPDPSANWTLAEAVGRLRYVLNACANDYHFTPSPADHEALDFLNGLVLLAAVVAPEAPR